MTLKSIGTVLVLLGLSQAYSRVQKAFEENGIEFARKEVWLQMSGQEEQNLTTEQKKAVSAAASEAAETTN